MSSYDYQQSGFQTFIEYVGAAAVWLIGLAIWFSAPAAALLDDTYDKADVVITLFLPPIVDWLYLLIFGG